MNIKWSEYILRMVLSATTAPNIIGKIHKTKSILVFAKIS